LPLVASLAIWLIFFPLTWKDQPRPGVNSKLPHNEILSKLPSSNQTWQFEIANRWMFIAGKNINQYYQYHSGSKNGGFSSAIFDYREPNTAASFCENPPTDH